MTYKVAMLITVGISLLENVKDRIYNDPDIKNNVISKWNQLPSEEKITQGIEDLYQLAYPSFQQDLKIYYNKLSNVSFPCAEVESFCYWLQEVAENQKGRVNLAKVILLPTKTDKARKCAEQVEKLLRDVVLQSTLAQNARIGRPCIEHICTPLLLHPAEDAGEFAQQFTQDVAEFLQQVGNIVNDLRVNGFDQIIINITGGYKVLVAIFSSFGFVRQDTDVKVIYKHEDTKFLADVPPLPVAWDLKLFDEYRSLLRGRQDINFEPPSKLRVMFHQKGDRWERTSFAQVLQKIYETDRLRRFGVGARLMRWFRDNSFKKKLEEGIARWEHIWIGDQIPETVEHSRGHSIRLLEYAADLLEPKLRTDPNFLSDEELYLLICCLWLHDIGHTGLKFKVSGTKTTIPVGLFPSLVRRWHNFLSCDLIRSADYLPEDEREAVALLSKYDRGKLPLLTSEGQWKDKVFPQITVEPLEKVIQNGLHFRNTIIPKNKALLLCALLRVIDGCDLQSDRVIDKNYWTERRQRTKAEVDYLWERLNQRWNFLSFCDNSYKNELKKIKEALEDCYNLWKEEGGWEKAQQVEEIIDNTIEPTIIWLIGVIVGVKVNDIVGGKKYNCSGWKSPDSMQKEILLDLLSLMARIAFKMRQEAHFFKHSQVKLVYITSHDDSYRFNMTFSEELGGITKDQKLALAKEVWMEVTKGVQCVLRQGGISFEGVFSGGERLYPSEEDNQ
jgi:hypothetical protein